MLKRAGVSFVIAVVAALWGFSGVLQVTAPLGRVLCFIAAGFGLLSLLLSLFERPAHSKPERSVNLSRSGSSSAVSVLNPLIVSARNH